MNLIEKINRRYILFLGLIFPIMICADYFLIKYFIDNEVEEVLLHEEQRINFHLEKNGTLPTSNYMYKSTQVENEAVANSKFVDTLFYEAYEDRYIPYKTYTFISSTDSLRFDVSLRHVLLDVNELLWLLFIITTITILFLIIGLYMINQRIYRAEWNPFLQNLSRLNSYDFSQKEPLKLNSSDINEFEELNRVITSLMKQVRKDFLNLKEFNENISHEIQTPLAIIRNKVVVMLESKNLNEKERKKIEAIYHETNKLSKIGKSLTLISRIENQEFQRLEPIDVSTIVENILSNMEEVIDFKNLDITTDLQSVTIECDHTLADILFTNLIKNAVQHNREGGWIKIKLGADEFQIINSGDVSEKTTDKLFARFQRGSSSKDSLGLGLAINQRICDIYGYSLGYDRNEDTHIFRLKLRNKD